MLGRLHPTSLAEHGTPFFDSRVSKAGGEPRRRLLLVTYHFPPGTAVGGVRWQQFARYFAELGWDIDVITREPGELDQRDDRRLEQLPTGIRVFGARTPAPFTALPQRLWRSFRRLVPRRAPRAVEAVGRRELGGVGVRRGIARAYFAWLDFAEGRAWARSAARVGRALGRETRYDAVASSGPPHMAHEAARLIARSAKLPLIADFRDPWSLVERVPEHIASPLWFALASRHERRIVQDAAVIAMNTDRSRDAMRRSYPALAERIVTVRNGSDDDPLPEGTTESRFTIRFAGSIYLDRDPGLVFRAVARVVHELSLSPHELGLLFMGDVESFGGKTLHAMAAEEGIAGFVETRPPRPRHEAMRFLRAAAMLLSLPQDSDMAIPAKIFEYVRFPAWLLVLAVAESATADVLRGTDADVVDPTDVDGLARIIRRRYEQFARGERPEPTGRNGQFDRRKQAEFLLDRIRAATPAS
jgi:hypothetical protein